MRVLGLWCALTSTQSSMDRNTEENHNSSPPSRQTSTSPIHPTLRYPDLRHTHTRTHARTHTASPPKNGPPPVNTPNTEGEARMEEKNVRNVIACDRRPRLSAVVRREGRTRRQKQKHTHWQSNKKQRGRDANRQRKETNTLNAEGARVLSMQWPTHIKHGTSRSSETHLPAQGKRCTRPSDPRHSEAAHNAPHPQGPHRLPQARTHTHTCSDPATRAER